MAKCRGCGASIVWLQTANGKMMPCDPTPVPYWEKEKATGKIVTKDGRIVSCEFHGVFGEQTGVGYIPHFATCPNAADFKRREK